MVLSGDAPRESENEDLGKLECPPHSAQQIRRPQGAMGWTGKRSLVLGRPFLHDSDAFQGEISRKRAQSKKRECKRRQSEIRVAVAGPRGSQLESSFDHWKKGICPRKIKIRRYDI